ncbi:MAG: 50S ribosomal protein L29 [Dehalococcoidia bacterium]
MKAAEARAMTPEALTTELEKTYKELFNLRQRQAAKELTNYQEIRETRKKIALIKTILRERELARA